VKLYIDYDATERIISDDYGKNGPYTGYRESEKDLTVNALRRKAVGPFDDSIEVDKLVLCVEIAWLVVVRYRTGSTFGHTSGEYAFIAVFDNRRAAKSLADEIQQDYKNSKCYELCPKIKNPAYNTISCSWKGYFERLENIEILGVPVE
jgi:hypothetical protein